MLSSISYGNPARKKIQVFFDGGCGPCTKLSKMADRVDFGDRMEFSPLWSEQANQMLPPTMDLSERMESVKVIDRKGRLFSGGEAVLVAAQSTIFAPAAWLLRAIPGHEKVIEPLYKWVASKRPQTCAIKT